MMKIKLLGTATCIVLLSGCAAYQGAKGDQAAAKEIAAERQQQAEQQGVAVSSQVTSTPAKSPSQNAATGAAKMIAPLTH